MKKLTKEITAKTSQQILSEVGKIRQEIAKLKLEAKINPPKDSNLLSKKRKKLAVMLTVLNKS